MDERVYSKDKSLHDRIKRSSRLTFDNIPANKATGEDWKVKQGEMEAGHWQQWLTSWISVVCCRSLKS